MEPHEDEVEFPFPFPAYEIQTTFMKSLYSTLRDKKLGIFESPTGTGKSLSMCCGALQWLTLHEEASERSLQQQIDRVKAELANMPESEDWLASEYNKIQQTQQLNALLSKVEKINQRRLKFEEMKHRVSQEKRGVAGALAGRVVCRVGGDGGGDEETHAPDDDEELLLQDEDEPEDTEQEQQQEEEESDHVQIYISSRTHSQLSQLLGEIRRTKFAASIRVVTLASRKHYCINTQVAKLENLQLINERCLDLQKSERKASAPEEGGAAKRRRAAGCGGCPYYNRARVGSLRDRVLSEVLDVEEVVRAGQQLRACPYYATRAAAADAQVVLVTHAGVVGAGARDAALRLRDAVLLVDEAHALPSALEQAHAAPLTLGQVARTRDALQHYKAKYGARLSSRNLLALNQLLYVLARLHGMIEVKPGEEGKQTVEPNMYTLEEFGIAAGIEHINLRPLVTFCEKTRLAHKLHSLVARHGLQPPPQPHPQRAGGGDSLRAFLAAVSSSTAAKGEVTHSQSDAAHHSLESSDGGDEDSGESGSVRSALHCVVAFLRMLCERSALGRVLAARGARLKYLLLDPTDQLRDITRQCRSVVLAGGTMEPVSEFRALLCDEREATRVTLLRCEHVVPADGVLAVCVSRGPTGLPFTFTYHHRNSNQILEEVGRTLRNLSSVVPGGVVVFLPSYTYERLLHDHLQAAGHLRALASKKKVFREPKCATQVDQVLSEYAAAVRSRAEGNTGAILFSVVGGKLSEGLNFSDDLGRCVVVVGMPYPNIKCAELREKLAHRARAQGSAAANEFYEGLCMKAVNQCIGRAVRHRHDYACMVLLDERFSRARTAAALPAFVRRSLHTDLSFGSAFSLIAKFFRQHKLNT